LSPDSRAGDTADAMDQRCRRRGMVWSAASSSFSGSYALNGWLYDTNNFGYTGGAATHPEFFMNKESRVQNAAQTPMFADATSWMSARWKPIHPATIFTTVLGGYRRHPGRDGTLHYSSAWWLQSRQRSPEF